MFDPVSFFIGAGIGIAAASLAIKIATSKRGDDKPSAPQIHDVWYFWTPEEASNVRDHLFAWLAQSPEVRGVTFRESVHVSVNMTKPISEEDLRAPGARWWVVRFEYQDEADRHVLLAKTRSLAWGDDASPFMKALLDMNRPNSSHADGAS